jgi:hypothetical protein
MDELVPLVDHKYELAPEALRITCSPVQAESAGMEDMIVLMAFGWVTIIDVEAVHPPASVMVTVYVPADNPVAVILVCEDGFHK